MTEKTESHIKNRGEGQCTTPKESYGLTIHPRELYRMLTHIAKGHYFKYRKTREEQMEKNETCMSIQRSEVQET